MEAADFRDGDHDAVAHDRPRNWRIIREREVDRSS
jgi:hypothetical protein